MQSFIRKLASTVVATLSLTVATTAVQAQQKPLTLAVTGQGTTIYSMGAPLAQLLEENGIPVRLQPMGGTTAYTPLFGTGEIDIGIVNLSVLQSGYLGEAPFPQANEEIRLATVLYPFMVGLIAREDSDVHTIADVAGMRLPGGFNQQPYINPIIRALLANGGLTVDDVEGVPVPTINAGLDDFDTGRIDVGYFGVGGGRVIQSDTAVGGLRFIPLADTPEAVAAMNEHLTGAFIRTLEPGSFVGIDQPTPVMAYDMMLAVGSDVPDETVARILEILADNQPALEEGFGGYADFAPDQMAKPEYEVPYHPGAIAFYESRGLWQ